MLEELKDLNSSSTFKAWMTLLNGGIPYETITKEMLINGLCEDLAYYLHVKYGVRIINISGTFKTIRHGLAPAFGHCCILDQQDRYFDGYNVEGVSDINELHWVKEIQSSFEHMNIIFKERELDIKCSRYSKYRYDLLEILKGG